MIIFSAVRANGKGRLGFLTDYRRLNVALTRAKRGLLVLGHRSTLQHDPVWASFLDFVDQHGLQGSLAGEAASGGMRREDILDETGAYRISDAAP